MVARRYTDEHLHQAYAELGSYKKVAEALGMNVRSIERRFQRMRHVSMDGRQIEKARFVKTTVQIGADGTVEREWPRFADDELDLERVQRFIDSFVKEVEPIPKIKAPKKRGLDTDLIPWFNIGDGHLGMLAHEAETGHNFDLKIGKRELMTALQIEIGRAPLTERCVIQDLGDMTHYETNDGITMGHGHSLDFDSRFPKMIDVYAEVMRFIVDCALKKYKYVDVIVNQGNHSRSNDQWMVPFLKHVYSDNKRLHVLNNKSVFIPYRMGNTFVMCHHQDKCKGPKLVDVMSTDFRQDFGEAKYKYIDTGHIHHRSVAKERGDVMIESWNQLAPMDKHAHDGGWRSRSCLCTVLRSKTYGERGRQWLTAEEVRDRIGELVPGTTANKRREVYTV